MAKYDAECINEKMADFIEFQSALRDQGHTFSDVGEILLYQVFKR